MRATLLRLVPAALFLSAALSAHAAPACPVESRYCPDTGTYVGRDPENDCEFDMCPGADGSFYDTMGHENGDAILYLRQQGVVQGYDDGTFRPDLTINRAEFTKILVGAALEPGDLDCGKDWGSPGGEGSPFGDVRGGDWFSNPVCRAYMEGLITGYPDGTFRPANAINFVEAAKILSLAFRISVTGMAQGDPWYKPAVLSLQQHNAIPTTITRFDQRITRGEMAEMIYRLKTGNNDKPSKTYQELDNGLSNDSFVEYDSEAGGFSIKHRLDWAITHDGATLEGDIANAYFGESTNGTALDMAWLGVHVLESCRTDGRAFGDPTIATFNGVTFAKQPVRDDAMGGARGEGNVYTAEKNGRCYQIETFVMYHDPSYALDAPDVAGEKRLAADKATAEALFARMLASFVIR